MSHFRHCPKHRKALPCAHCALAAKPAQAAVAVIDAQTEPAPVASVPQQFPCTAKGCTEIYIVSVGETVAVMEPEPTEPSPAEVNAVIKQLEPAAPVTPKKPGRPRVHPPGTTDAERMVEVRARHKREKQEKKRKAELKRTIEHDDTETRGQFIANADEGRGRLFNGRLSLERIDGWRQIKRLFRPTALDKMSDEEFQEKLGQAFSRYPDLAEYFGDNSIDEIKVVIQHQLSGASRNLLPSSLDLNGTNLEEGRQGRVAPQGYGSGEDSEDWRTHGPRIIKSFPPKLRDGEAAQIDDCLRKLRDDERYIVWSKTDDDCWHCECKLCHEDLGLLTLLGTIRNHFVDHHRKELRKFFREHRCPPAEGLLQLENEKLPINEVYLAVVASKRFGDTDEEILKTVNAALDSLRTSSKKKFRVCRLQRMPNKNGVGFREVFTLPIDGFVFDSADKAFEHLNKPRAFQFQDNHYWVQSSEDGKVWEETPTSVPTGAQ